MTLALRAPASADSRFRDAAASSHCVDSDAYINHRSHPDRTTIGVVWKRYWLSARMRFARSTASAPPSALNRDVLFDVSSAHSPLSNGHSSGLPVMEMYSRESSNTGSPFAIASLIRRFPAWKVSNARSYFLPKLLMS